MKTQKQFQHIGLMLIVIILTLLGNWMYGNYTATKHYEEFKSELSYIENRSDEILYDFSDGFISKEKGLKEIEELTSRFEEIEHSINYWPYNFSPTQLLIIRNDLYYAGSSLEISKNYIEKDGDIYKK